MAVWGSSSDKDPQLEAVSMAESTVGGREHENTQSSSDPRGNTHPSAEVMGIDPRDHCHTCRWAIGSGRV